MQHWFHVKSEWLAQYFKAWISISANSKGTPDLNVWVWDENKALDYLKQKTEKLCKEILEKGLTLLDNTSSSNYISSNRPLESQDQESKKSAWEFISDFLQEDLSQKLAKILEIDLETPIANKVVKSETTNSSSSKGTDFT